MNEKCNCKFNEDCHIPRQYVQLMIRERNPHRTVKNCDFYVMITEKLKGEMK